jgi:pimeloyl-ACP methyl ester carboxylesterase
VITSYAHAGLTFDVRDGGPADGVPVVLLHGFPQEAAGWAAVEQRLHTAGLRTLAPDQRGYSPGARPTGRREYAIDHLVGDVLALLDAAGLESAHVVGHDWGGLVAWVLAGRHPERVRSLVAVSTPHPAAMTRALRHGGQALKSWYMFAIQVPVLPELALRATMEPALRSTGMPAEAVARARRRLAGPGLRGALNWYRGMPFWIRARLPRVAVPTTYLWGNRDPFLGREAALGTASFVTGDYRFVELDAGHWLPEKQAAAIAEQVLERAGEG